MEAKSGIAELLGVERFRTEYNTEHLHSSLGYMTPEEFASAQPVGA